MDNYQLISTPDATDTTGPSTSAVSERTQRHFRKVGCVGFLFLGCGFLWQASQTPLAKGGVLSYNIPGVYTDADLVAIFGRDGPKAEHIRRPQLMVATHSGVDVDSDLGSHDIYQGRLGDCWFDAALAAVVHRHKDLIAAMFEHIDANQGVFRTRWFFGGQWISVTVNAKIPVDPTTRNPFFLWTSSELTLWPAILEKSFAKLAGNYKAIEGGDPAEALQYILGVPVNLINLGEDNTQITGANNLDDVWHQIVEAADSHWPMEMGTLRGGYHGISGGHAYTLYGYHTNYQGHARVLRVRNPWGTNGYTGDIHGQTRTIGDFLITWDEFLRNFVEVRIAVLRPGYHVQMLNSVPVTAQGVHGSVTVHVSHDGPFSVQALWMGARVTEAAHCPPNEVDWQANPSFYMQRGGGPMVGGTGTINGMRVDGNGAGTWTVHLSLPGHFSGLPRLSVSAYVPAAGSLSLAAALEKPSTLLISTSGVNLPSTNEAPEASLQPMVMPGCLDYYGRLTHDMNLNVIPSDPHFPENENSITSVGGNCGDAAHGFHQACSGYNHWQDMTVIANMEADDRNCFTFDHVGDKCHVTNRHCQRNAILFCHIVGCATNTMPIAPGNMVNTLDAACCGCNDRSNFR